MYLSPQPVQGLLKFLLARQNDSNLIVAVLDRTVYDVQEVWARGSRGGDWDKSATVVFRILGKGDRPARLTFREGVLPLLSRHRRCARRRALRHRSRARVRERERPAIPLAGQVGLAAFLRSRGSRTPECAGLQRLPPSRRSPPAPAYLKTSTTPLLLDLPVPFAKPVTAKRSKGGDWEGGRRKEIAFAMAAPRDEKDEGSKTKFKAMLPSQYQTAGKKPTGGIRAENSTTFRFFGTGDAGEKPGTTARSALASCLDEASDMVQ